MSSTATPPLFETGGAAADHKPTAQATSSAPVDQPLGLVPPFAAHEYMALWKRPAQYKELAQEAENGLNTSELFAGFRLKVEKELTPTMVVTHAVEMGGHHAKDERARDPLGMPAPPKTNDPSSYEFSMRYMPKSGSTITSMLRSDGFMYCGVDLRVAPWLDVHLAGQFFGNGGNVSVFAADIHGKHSVTTLKMIQQVAYELNYMHSVSPKLALGSSLSYDTMAFWTSGTVAARYVWSFRSGSSKRGLRVPEQITTFEVGTLAHKEQALATPKPGATTFENTLRPIGFVSATHWLLHGENYRIMGMLKMSKEGATERKQLWMPSAKLGMEYVTQTAHYKGSVDLYNMEVASEIREQLMPGLLWTMCAKVNYWEQTYRFGAGLQLST